MKNTKNGLFYISWSHQFYDVNTLQRNVKQGHQLQNNKTLLKFLLTTSVTDVKTAEEYRHSIYDSSVYEAQTQISGCHKLYWAWIFWFIIIF